MRRSSRLKVKIPAGIDNGQFVRLAGQGKQATGGPPGDLLIVVHVRPHELSLAKETMSFAKSPSPLASRFRR